MYCIVLQSTFDMWNRGAAICWDIALRDGRSRVRYPVVSFEFFYWLNPSGPIVALESTQFVIEMSSNVWCHICSCKLSWWNCMVGSCLITKAWIYSSVNKHRLSSEGMRELRILQNLKLTFSEDKVPLENCALLGYYRARSGNFLPTFRDNLSVSSSGFKKGFFSTENGTDNLSRNFGKKLPLPTA
jgi:hypothetical protein